MSETDEGREHRRRAQECVEIAAKIYDPAHRVFILGMAKTWTNLAEKAERRATDAVWAN
jgi:hypothetical protein